MFMKIKKYILSFLICGVVLFICYLIAGVLGEVFNENASVTDALETVFTSPFSNHFNDFTPIMLILGFIVFEIGWFFKYIRPSIVGNGNKVETKIVSENGIKYKQINITTPETTDNSSNMSSEGISGNNTESFPVPGPEKKAVDAASFGFVISDDILNGTEKEESSFEEESDIKEVSTVKENDDYNDELSDSFSSDVFWELNGEYSPEQIKEMLQLKKYIKTLDVNTLRETFKPTLQPFEIKEYIELFYN